jgi:hypothetical protein
MLAAQDPQTANDLLERAQEDVQRQWETYEARAASAITPRVTAPTGKEAEVVSSVPPIKAEP